MLIRIHLMFIHQVWLLVINTVLAYLLYLNIFIYIVYVVVYLFIRQDRLNTLCIKVWLSSVALYKRSIWLLNVNIYCLVKDTCSFDIFNWKCINKSPDR